MGLLRRIAALYGEIGRTYLSWARSLLPLALIVFVPLGFLDAIASHFDANQIDLGDGVKIAALLAEISAITATSLIGEVFYSGAVAISLTHPREERPPPLREIARRIDYRRLIAVDIVYVLIVVAGFALLLVPGVLAFVYLGLSGPVVEIERRTVRGALRRSFQLVRGSFWLAFGVFVPIEIVAESLSEGIEALVHTALGESLLASWAAESASAIAFTPVFAVAAVLLTLHLIARRDGDGPGLNRSPAPAESVA